MQSIKEKASNIAASAKAGMDKTRAAMQEKVERVTAHNPAEKERATEKKEERIHEAEGKKQETHEHNAAAKESNYGTGGPHSYSTTGVPGQSTGMHQMSALPGHGTGQPTGQVVEGVAHSHPIATATGTTRPSTAHNPRQGAGTNMGYGTGGSYD